MTRPVTEQARVQLGRAVAARRKSLGLSVARATAAAEISRTTWTAVEAGTRDTEGFIHGKIEKVLRWEPGSVDAILDGGTATPVGSTPRQQGQGPEGITDPDLIRYLAIMADPDVDAALKQVMRNQIRVWSDQVELLKNAAVMPRRRSA